MSVISNVNATISDHIMVTTFVGFAFLATGAILGLAAINQRGDFITPAYTTLQPAIVTTTEPAVKVQTVPQSSTLKVTTADASDWPFRTQQPDMVSYLQPAPNTIQNPQSTASTLQPARGSIQLTGNNLQNASAILQ
jgi:hypothetical protein